MFDIVVVESEVRDLHLLMNEVGRVRFGDPQKSYADEEELISLIKDADAVVCTARGRFTGKVISSAGNLKIIAKCGSAPNNIDIKTATECGVAVTYTPGANRISVAEHALTLMMALLKLLPQSAGRLRNGQWKGEDFQAAELFGKTVGIIGLGQTGSALARLLSVFDVNLLCFDPYAGEKQLAEAGAKPVDLDTLLAVSDIVSIHCQLNDETRHIVNRDRLGKMKKSAILINTARGALVDEDALVEALRDGWIMGAGIDVYGIEPALKDNPLFYLDNVAATPHLAGWTKECLARESAGTSQAVIKMLKGQVPDNVLNPDYVKFVKRP